MTVTFRDKIILIAMASMLCVYGGYRVLWTPTVTKASQLKAEKQQIEALSADITPLLEQEKKLVNEDKQIKEKVEGVRNHTGGGTATSEEFLVFLGNETVENNVMVTGFNDLGTNEENGIHKAVFDFELQGESTDINRVLDAMENMGIKYSVGSVSFRQSKNYDYLNRFFDGLTGLQWYQEPEEEESIPEEQEPGEMLIPKIDDFLPFFNSSEQSETIVEEPRQTEEPQQTDEPRRETPMPEPTEPPKEENINDRLDKLLEQTAYYYSVTGYRVMLLEGENEMYKTGQNMRLAVTVCLVMFHEPTKETSFLNALDMEGENGVL